MSKFARQEALRIHKLVDQAVNDAIDGELDPKDEEAVERASRAIDVVFWAEDVVTLMGASEALYQLAMSMKMVALQRAESERESQEETTQ